MPTLDNPTWYELADGIAPGRVDDFLKWIDPDYYTDDTGSVESPFGHVALIQITPDIIANYASTFGEPWITERRNFAPGWYIIRTDDNGLVWGMSYGGWCDDHEAFCADTHEEQKARKDFNETAKAYAEWDDREDI